MGSLDGMKLLEQGYVNLGRDDVEHSKEEIKSLREKYEEFVTIEGVCYGLPKKKLENLSRE